jgi:hypothetical protein
MAPTTKRTSIIDSAMEPEVKMIEDALVGLLHEITAIDTGLKAPVRGGASRLQIVQASEIPVDMSRAQSAARALGQSPIRAACARAITVLGERLNEIGGKALMHDALDRVVARAGRHKIRWSDIIDRRFNGVGGWWS